MKPQGPGSRVVIEVGISGIGLLGPGMSDWEVGRLVLRDPAGWQRVPTIVGAPQRLPATERRRAGTMVKASVLVADQALAAGGADPATLATVFTSSTGDTLNCHLLCEALARPDRLLSPTRFTNSVHNAPAGYWHIATVSRAASTSLAAHDASFAAGLLEAAVQCRSSGQPVLLVACDVPYPEPLHAVRALADTFATALLVVPSGGRLMRLQPGPATADTACVQAGLEDLRQTIPAARALPLLQCLAASAGGAVEIGNLPGSSLRIEVEAA